MWHWTILLALKPDSQPEEQMQFSDKRELRIRMARDRIAYIFSEDGGIYGLKYCAMRDIIYFSIFPWRRFGAFRRRVKSRRNSIKFRHVNSRNDLYFI